ncbi:type I-E CRISPR-associated protein Cse2/CasB [Cutibacterium equinum]|uniref:Type I-E CRISPR-associated protein Cse2/CasB n=1 Tax=Cutibacterium equinum TaxID=3016342 RepID=A0ABY7QZX2_9ACTN|nr:type I-E CRISPR-associated protein Cse2/CasB [Cutibacterium equinum]WCC79817.1 type I-E CRISPR-associated protein Cse2/CasB [Cutibacterium equinum]
MPEPWNDVTSAAVSSINRLQHGYLAAPRDPWAVRSLASLRRADATRPGADPGLWDVILGHLPDYLLGQGTAPATPAERAVHAAVVLYAVHQQSRSEPMHVRGIGLGQAVRTLSMRRSSSTEWDPGTISRFQHMCRAQQWAIRVGNLRGLVTLMRSEAVPLDYGHLAADLWRLQVSSPDQVLLEWGRQLHRIPANQTTSAETDQGEPR